MSALGMHRLISYQCRSLLLKPPRIPNFFQNVRWMQWTCGFWSMVQEVSAQATFKRPWTLSLSCHQNSIYLRMVSVQDCQYLIMLIRLLADLINIKAKKHLTALCKLQDIPEVRCYFAWTTKQGWGTICYHEPLEFWNIIGHLQSRKNKYSLISKFYHILLILVNATGGRPRPALCFLPGRLMRTLVPKGRYGNLLSGCGSNTQPSNW